jgi:hypothetical protein
MLRELRADPHMRTTPADAKLVAGRALLAALERAPAAQPVPGGS